MDYADHGAVERQELGNELWEFIAYNDRLQPEDMRLGTTQDGSQVWRSRLSYDLLSYNSGGGACSGQSGGDNNGNIWSQTITAPRVAGGTMALQQTYDYDAVNRLTVASESGGVGAWSRTNAYDPFGNRTVNVGVQQTISDTTNRITGVTGMAAPGYDPAGNMLFHPEIGTLVYDAENRQTSFTATGKSGAYVYDGEGRRVRRTPGGIGEPTTVYVYDAFGKLAAEYSPEAPSGTGGTFYRTTDHLGSTRVVTQQDGTVCERRDYYPFGERIPTSSGDARSEVNGYALTCGFDQRFTGKERDDESGLDYFGARYYTAALGRFAGADTPFADQDSADPQSWNLYVYVRSRPLLLIDFNGRQSATGYTIRAARTRPIRVATKIERAFGQAVKAVDYSEVASARGVRTAPKSKVFPRTGRGQSQFGFPANDTGSVGGIFSKLQLLYVRTFIRTTSANLSFQEGGENMGASVRIQNDPTVVTIGPDPRKAAGGEFAAVSPDMLGSGITLAVSAIPSVLTLLDDAQLNAFEQATIAQVQDSEFLDAILEAIAAERARQSRQSSCSSSDDDCSN